MGLDYRSCNDSILGSINCGTVLEFTDRRKKPICRTLIIGRFVLCVCCSRARWMGSPRFSTTSKLP